MLHLNCPQITHLPQYQYTIIHALECKHPLDHQRDWHREIHHKGFLFHGTEPDYLRWNLLRYIFCRQNLVPFGGSEYGLGGHFVVPPMHTHSGSSDTLTSQSLIKLSTGVLPKE